LSDNYISYTYLTTVALGERFIITRQVFAAAFTVLGQWRHWDRGGRTAPGNTLEGVTPD